MKKTTYTPYSADNDEIDFGQQLRVIWMYKYKILAALLAGGILGAAFSLASTPQYRADAMLEIETRQNQILTEINSIFNNQTTPSEAEVELVQSRLVLGKTVDDPPTRPRSQSQIHARYRQPDAQSQRQP